MGTSIRSLRNVSFSVSEAAKLCPAVIRVPVKVKPEIPNVGGQNECEWLFEN